MSSLSVLKLSELEDETEKGPANETNGPADSETKTGLDTPRTNFVKTQLTNPVYLNPNTDLSGNHIFQVSINPEQITNYTQITTDTSIECFIQCLFVLGLRNINEAKDDLIRLKSARVGTSWDEACNYLQHIFGNHKIIHKWYSLGFGVGPRESEWRKQYMNKIMNKIDNNNATILTVKFKNTETKKEWAHYVIAYKNNGDLFYFDPQNNIHDIDPNKLSQSPIIVAKFGYFEVINDPFEHPVLVSNTTLPITFTGGKTRCKARGKTKKLNRRKVKKTYRVRNS